MSETIFISTPIKRSFSYEGSHYVYGVLPFEVDAYGTMLTETLVLDNLEQLKIFPSVRFMHKTPLGQIDFENIVDGYYTHVDRNGFHVLIRVYSTCKEEFSMIQQGEYGLSYGLLPSKTEQTTIEGKSVEKFISGKLYEISVVDTPAIEQEPVTILRSLEKRIPQGFLAMLESALPPTTQTRSQDRELTPIDLEYRLPVICQDSCEFKRHCSSYPENLGALCVKRWEQFKNRPTPETHIPQHPFKE